MEVVVYVLSILFFFWIAYIIGKGSDKPSNKDNQSIKKDSSVSNTVIEKIKNGNIDINSIPFDIEERVKSNREKYEDDLNDERWKKKRDKILKIHSYRCPCGNRENLQIHHKYHNKYPDGCWVRAWDYPDNALMVLCDDCHKRYHKNHKSPVYYRKKGVHYEKV